MRLRELDIHDHSLMQLRLQACVGLFILQPLRLPIPALRCCDAEGTDAVAPDP